MITYKCTIEGISPILFNRMTEEQQEKISNHVTGGKTTVEAKREEAQKKVYRNEKGLYLPSENLIKCLMNGSTKASLKYGRKSLTPFIEALVFTDTMEIPFRNGKSLVKEPDFMDERPGRVPPRTGARVMLYRPGLQTGWKLSFKLLIMDDRLPEANIKSALEEAGILSGLCDYRPRFGRFRVTEWGKTEN